MGKKSIIRDNFLLSLGFGILMGLVFPLYASLFVVFKSKALFAVFLVGCVLAGIIVGLVSFLINKATVLKTVAEVSLRLKSVNISSPDTVQALKLDSMDVLGELADGFSVAIQEMQKLVSMLSAQAGTAINTCDSIKEKVREANSIADSVDNGIIAISAAVKSQDGHNVNMLFSFDELIKRTILDTTNIVELYSYLGQFGKTLLEQGKIMEELMSNLTSLGMKISGGSNGTTETESKNTLLAAARELRQEAQSTANEGRKIFAAVREALAVLSDISERTGVLAINAAIESSRLGKEAAGFRVISSSVRDLATESVRAVTELSSRIELGEKSLAESEAREANAGDLHEKLIEEVERDISVLAEKNQAILGGAQVLSKGQSLNSGLLKEIRDSILCLKTIIEQNRSALAGISSQGRDIDGQVEKLKEGMNLLKGAETDVKVALDQFETRLSPVKELTRAWGGEKTV